MLDKIKGYLNEKRIIPVTLAVWGIICISTGLILNMQDRTEIQNKYSLKVNTKQVADLRVNEIVPKDMKLEVNNPLSVDPKDYIENANTIDPSIIKALKLDTSMVNINEPGIYTYTITFKSKKYNGSFTITAKEIPNFTLTLKEVNLSVGDAISTNVSSYIKENLTEEVKNNLTLDLREVTTNAPGTYYYKVIYGETTYTGKVIVTEKQKGVTVYTPTTGKEESKEETNTNTN